MIQIDRRRDDESGRVIEPNEAWFSLAEKGLEELMGDPAAVKESIYKHIEVKKALEKLFHQKCAYCESPLAEFEFDVEHFRPKGRVHERTDFKHGYYWLAYDWENLFPACKPCNQKRKDHPTWDDHTEGPAQGKADRFPLVDETTRAMGLGEPLGDESRLLINPCDDDPREHLWFGPMGEVFGLTEAGAKSVELYNLRR